MNTITKIIPFIIAWMFLPAVYAQTWSLVGEAVPGGSVALQQDNNDPTLFLYAGRLSSQSFRIFDGEDYYAPLCAENDPLVQSIDFQRENSASEAGFRIRYTSANDYFKITVKKDETIQQISAERLTPPQHLYLIGGPVNTHDPNWMLYDVKELEQDPENPFIFYYKGFLRYNTFGDERGSIKFLSSLAWDPAYHPDGTSNVALADASKMRLGGSDTKWTIPADGSGNGYYVIRLNTLDETIGIDEFNPDLPEYPQEIYVTGAAMPCGWTNESPEVMSTVDGQAGVYSWTGETLEGEYKFLKTQGSWGECYVATTENERVVFGQSYPIVFEFEYWTGSGNDYKFVMPEVCRSTITVNLEEMSMKVVKADLNDGIDEMTSGNSRWMVYYNPLTRLLHIASANPGDGEAIVRIFDISGKIIGKRKLGDGWEVALQAGVYLLRMETAATAFQTKVMI